MTRGIFAALQDFLFIYEIAQCFARKKKKKRRQVYNERLRRKLWGWMGDGGDSREPFSCQRESYHLRSVCGG